MNSYALGLQQLYSCFVVNHLVFSQKSLIAFIDSCKFTQRYFSITKIEALFFKIALSFVAPNDHFNGLIAPYLHWVSFLGICLGILLFSVFIILVHWFLGLTYGVFKS